jgi:archaellum component FlaC
MTAARQGALDFEGVSTEAIEELTNRVQDIDNSYRAVAEKMGQLYMSADSHKVAGLTSRLDKPMRNASENEQMFAALLEELNIHLNRRR